ncbi:MAG: glycerol-3-phosphate dehydrogenase/oxidase [Acidobacteria bacterium]|nr:glycerol-3-phosphate dehydrogenase/oxidase [Acidobacteriota bacterium]
MPDSPPTRPCLEGRAFDIVVIGGGINGIAIARECARAGARVLLLDQHDFASGTTSRATRIVHGGLRYLEHGDLALVRESLRERERLLAEKPHLVRPMRFTLALRNGVNHGVLRSKLAIRAGLWLYGRMRPATSPREPAAEQSLERLLETDSGWALFDYDDAQCEFPERLAAEWLLEAAGAGAVVRNHTRVLAVLRQAGCVCGVTVRDLLSGKECRIASRQVVNATGPWADSVIRDSGLNTGACLVGGVRGSHIVLRSFPGAPRSAIYAEAADRRPVFVIPWNEMLLVGTTEVPDGSDPACTKPEPAEIDYLLRAFNGLVPFRRATRENVVYAYSGIRPLPRVENLAPSSITRRHILYTHDFEGAAGLVSVVGGKLTTAASLARDCARLLKLRVPCRATMVAAGPPADGIENSLRQWARQVAVMAHITEAAAASIAEWHGRSAICIARMASAEPRMRRALCPHSEHIVAEAVNAFRYEYAVNAADALLRRVPVALSGCWSEDCTRTAVVRIGAVMGWTHERQEREIEAMETERNAFLVRLALTRPQSAAQQSRII